MNILTKHCESYSILDKLCIHRYLVYYYSDLSVKIIQIFVYQIATEEDRVGNYENIYDRRNT